MTDSLPARLPAFVLKRDGRRVPFDADKISQALFAASGDLGHPSAFLAREMTDGVLHFLAGDLESETPTTGQIAEVVTKVVRELGQPALAQAFSQRQQNEDAVPPQEKADRSRGTFTFAIKESPQVLATKFLESYSLQAIYSRDLVAAHEEGLLQIGKLDRPEELDRAVVQPTPPQSLEDPGVYLTTPAATLVFDGPEHFLTDSTAGPWVQNLAAFCQTAGKQALLNLHLEAPPPWLAGPGQGPLFEAKPDAANCAAVLPKLVEALQSINPHLLNWNWHLSERDFASEQSAAFLAFLERRPGQRRFTLDRPKRPVVLAPGLDRQHPAVLLEVELDLPKFLGMPEVRGDGKVFLEKLPSLTRMGVRAGVQKRTYLRTRSADLPALGRAFLLERARLILLPQGLNMVVQTLLGAHPLASKLTLDLARQILQTLQATCQQESRATGLEIALGLPPTDSPLQPGEISWDQQTVKRVQAAAQLLEAGGIQTLHFPGSLPTVQDYTSFLELVWRKTNLPRVEF